MLPGVLQYQLIVATLTNSKRIGPCHHEPHTTRYKAFPNSWEQAIHNMIKVFLAIGGSTNVILHLLALAAELDLSLSRRF